MSYRPVPFSDVKNTFSTGDVMLFHGMRNTSHLTEIIEGSLWSHVGMVIMPQDIGLTYDKPLLWESNTLLNLPDVELDHPKTGPMLVDLEERMQTDLEDGYDNIFRVRYLNPGLMKRNKEQAMESLKKFIAEAHKADFPKTEIGMYVDYLVGRLGNIDIDKKNYFCSELVAETYIQMGLLSTSYVASGYLPKDFDVDGNLPLLARASLKTGPFITMKKGE